MSQLPPRAGLASAGASRFGARFARIDPEAIAKAEAALKSLSSQFGQWLEEEVAKLEAARDALLADGVTQAGVDRLFTHAHDLKGLGATYAFPLVTRIAGSLCKAMGDGEDRTGAPMALLDAHVSAIRTAVHDNLQQDDDPVGGPLAANLERRTAEHLAAQAG